MLLSMDPQTFPGSNDAPPPPQSPADELEMLLRRVEPGEFIEIRRLGRNGLVSVVAQKFTGDAKEAYAAMMRDYLKDELEAVLQGQFVEMSITPY